MLTIFGNLRINDSSKLRHMKDSFNSFSEISDDWVINVRGKYREEAMRFLKKNLGYKLTLFNLEDDSRGWSKNALEMIKKVRNEHLLLWNEDHINLAPQKIYRDLLKELKKEKVDSMWYSWWLFGKSRKAYDSLRLKKLKHVDTVMLTCDRWKKINQPGYPFYITSMMSIFSKKFFKRLLDMDRKMFPFRYTQELFSFLMKLNGKGVTVLNKDDFPTINKFFFYKFRKFPEVTPFNLEKEQYRTDILPIKIALPKRELFACIEDDLEEPGYSLISRGLYKGEKVRNKG